MFRRKSKKGIELVSISKRKETEKPEPTTSSELKARRRAIRSMSFNHSSKNTAPLQPLEDKKAIRKISEPLIPTSDSTKTRVKFVSPVHQSSLRTDAKLKLVPANSDNDNNEEPKPTKVHTSRFTMKIVPHGMQQKKTNGRINYRHSTYISGSSPITGQQLKKSNSQEEMKTREETITEEEKEGEAVQTIHFDEPSDDKSDSLLRDRTGTNKSLFDVSYEL